jgi:hypothetical protein
MRPTIEKCEKEAFSTSYKKRSRKPKTPLMFESFLFSPPSLPFHFQTFHAVSALSTSPSLFVMPPKGNGPWALDKVKQRLRAEQVERERAAAARYRRQEERGNRQETQSTAASAMQLSAVYFSSLLWFVLSCLSSF